MTICLCLCRRRCRRIYIYIYIYIHFTLVVGSVVVYIYIYINYSCQTRLQNFIFSQTDCLFGLFAHSECVASVCVAQSIAIGFVQCIYIYIYSHMAYTTCSLQTHYIYIYIYCYIIITNIYYILFCKFYSFGISINISSD